MDRSRCEKPLNPVSLSPTLDMSLRSIIAPPVAFGWSLVVLPRLDPATARPGGGLPERLLPLKSDNVQRGRPETPCPTQQRCTWLERDTAHSGLADTHHRTQVCPPATAPATGGWPRGPTLAHRTRGEPAPAFPGRHGRPALPAHPHPASGTARRLELGRAPSG